MDANALPFYDMSDNPTACCPRFNADGWDGQELHFSDKMFVKATTRSFFYIPLNMGGVFDKTFSAIEKANASSEHDFIVLSRDISPWTCEHFFSVTRDVPGLELTSLNGDYLTKVFEGSFKDAPKWEKAMASYVAEKGKSMKRNYFFYTTCPKCAKYYGKNYVVLVAELAK